MLPMCACFKNTLIWQNNFGESKHLAIMIFSIKQSILAVGDFMAIAICQICQFFHPPSI